jgi:hypothetical protein
MRGWSAGFEPHQADADNGAVTPKGKRRAQMLVSLFPLSAWVLNLLHPSTATFVLAIVAVVVALIFVFAGPLKLNESDQAELARVKNPDPDYQMTAYDVAEATGLPVAQVVRDLGRNLVPRVGLARWLPVTLVRVRYRREDIERWRGGGRVPQIAP